MRVVVAPDSFKGSLSAAEAAEAIATGWRRVRPLDELAIVPLADGGEGTVDAFATALPHATRHSQRVAGPDGAPVDADWLMLDDGTAVLELAQSSGLPLMASLDPLGAHTIGLGELARRALADGATRLVIGLGGSASTDGGVGALCALGARFLDSRGRELPPGGAALLDLYAIDHADLIPPPTGGVELLCDVSTVLLGTAGAAALFGPQKGATRAHIDVLDQALARFADVAGGDPWQSGAGAAGGTAFGLASLWGARIVPGSRSVAELVALPRRLDAADVVITGEGSFDATSSEGKVVSLVSEFAATAGARVGVVAGRIAAELPAGALGESLADAAGSIDAAIAGAAEWTATASERLARRFDAIAEPTAPTSP